MNDDDLTEEEINEMLTPENINYNDMIDYLTPLKYSILKGRYVPKIYEIDNYGLLNNLYRNNFLTDLYNLDYDQTGAYLYLIEYIKQLPDRLQIKEILKEKIYCEIEENNEFDNKVVSRGFDRLIKLSILFGDLKPNIYEYKNIEMDINEAGGNANILYSIMDLTADLVKKVKDKPYRSKSNAEEIDFYLANIKELHDMALELSGNPKYSEYFDENSKEKFKEWSIALKEQGYLNIKEPAYSLRNQYLDSFIGERIEEGKKTLGYDNKGLAKQGVLEKIKRWLFGVSVYDLEEKEDNINGEFVELNLWERFKKWLFNVDNYKGMKEDDYTKIEKKDIQQDGSNKRKPIEYTIEGNTIFPKIEKWKENKKVNENNENNENNKNNKVLEIPTLKNGKIEGFKGSETEGSSKPGIRPVKLKPKGSDEDDRGDNS